MKIYTDWLYNYSCKTDTLCHLDNRSSIWYVLIYVFIAKEVELNNV